MSKLTISLIAVLALALPLLGGCPDQAGTNNSGQAFAKEDDPHAGHDHATEPEPAAVEDEHAGHDHGEEEVADDPHAGHDHGDDEEEATGGITLTSEQIRELGIVTSIAGPGSIGRELELTGELSINEDAVTHVSPRISGIIRKVHCQLGDNIRVGAPLLELDSIELAEVKGDYLAVLSRLNLAQETLKREQMLKEKGISAEQDYLAAKQAYDEELITRRTIEYKLLALGISEGQVSDLQDNPGALMTSFTVYSPVGGEIIEKHASLGENLEAGTEVFTIGDLSTVWARFNVYQQDFLDIREGMEVVVEAGHGIEPVSGRIDYIEPLLGAETRTAVARVTLERSSEVYRPGLFVTGYVEIGGGDVELLVPRNAVVDLDQDKLLFVRNGTDFVPRVVTLGHQTAASIEVLTGLAPGEEVVVAGAFQLKAELLKGTFDPHAGHAH